MKGELIGINTAIATGGYERGNRGVGFAIPSKMASRIMSDLIEKGYVSRSWLGVYIQELDDKTAKALDLDIRDGALITDVVSGSPAEKAGIQEGDIIVSFNGESITDPSNLKNVVSLTKTDQKSKAKIIRDGKYKTIDVILENLPDNPQSLATRLDEGFDQFGFKLKKITNQLKQKYDVNAENSLIVVGIDRNGEAYKKGIREGDIIKRVGTKKVTSVSEFNNMVDSLSSKGAILVLVKKKDGASRFYTLEL